MQNEKNVVAAKNLIIGAKLNSWATGKQWEAFWHLADHVDFYASTMCDGYLSSVAVSLNRLTLTVPCKNPELAMKILRPMLEQFEGYIPDDYGMSPIFLYCSTEDNPAPQYVSMDNQDDEEGICDECLKAEKEKEAAKK